MQDFTIEVNTKWLVVTIVSLSMLGLMLLLEQGYFPEIAAWLEIKSK